MKKQSVLDGVEKSLGDLGLKSVSYHCHCHFRIHYSMAYIDSEL